MMTRTFLLFAALLTGTCCFAQDVRETFEQYRNRRQQEFNQYRDARQREFEEYRRKRNEEFAKYMRRAWQDVNPGPVIPKPKDEPVPPVVEPPIKEVPQPVPKPLPYDEVVPAPKPEPQPQPIEPIEEIKPEPQPVPVPVPTCSFTFFGTNGKVRYDSKHSIKIGTLSENNIADAWLKFSQETYTNLIYDCLQLRSEHNLCDWAYLVMLEKMAEAVCGKGTNESTLLMAYVYCQSGYKMRLGMDGGRLYMMFASHHVIFNWTYYILDGEKYYTYGKKKGNLQICAQQYPKEQPMSLLVSTEQKFDMATVNSTPHQSTEHPEMSINLSVNKNMLDFYTSYPTSMIGDNHVSRWAIYANTPMPEYVQQQVYPQLRAAIKGCTQIEAVTKILNMIQTGFPYEYDDKVWGGDRAFFPEESLHYQYCDCEDRAILIARLVRDLLGLRSILIYYPGHLAAAVEFTQSQPSGDYIEVGGRRYIITDGAILYATPVGRTMRGMDNKTAKVIVL